MNYKLLFPSYRNRYLFIQKQLKDFGSNRPFQHILNLGTGEGDYDPMIAPFGKQLTACDINASDIAFAKELNTHLSNINYRVENALELSFADDTFDLITSVDVLEHVGQPALMVKEIGRVLRPGGLCFITFPYLNFPFTYDPINKIYGWFKPEQRLIAQGAYAFGHEYLIKGSDFYNWAQQEGLEVIKEQALSGMIIALLESYWTGIIQSIFKANSSNLSTPKTRKGTLRPSLKEPSLVKLTDTLIAIDKMLFGQSKTSVGRGFVLRKV